MKFEFDPLFYSFPSRRNCIYSKRGMVATGNPIAAQAGLDILRKGGNAVDAAVATAVTLSVVEPTANGIGSDAFAILYINGKLIGMNSSGYAPKALKAEELLNMGYKKMPEYGAIPVTVPGAPKAWATLIEKYGNLSLEEVMESAIRYAREGFVIQTGVGRVWKASYMRYKKELENNSCFKSWFDTFAPNDHCMEAGDYIILKDHADSLEKIAKSGADEFYKGELAEKIVRFLQDNGSKMTLDDLSDFKTEFVETIKTDFKGFEVHEIPPNGHGITVLMALNILKHMDMENIPDFIRIHREIEAMKLAFTDAQMCVTDAREMKVKTDYLLSDEYAKGRAALISDIAIEPKPCDKIKGGTVYLCTADSEGNMVSYIQSNYMGFGSGLVVPGTGISLHNRGANFSLDLNHDNCIKGGKKPYHTIIPGFLMKDGKPVGPFGIMGGFMQPQAHLQVMLSSIMDKRNPQDALDKPRWMWTGDKTIEVEASFDINLAQKLKRMGHDIKVSTDVGQFGRGEIIWRNDDGIYCGGTEPRTDGCIAAW